MNKRLAIPFILILSLISGCDYLSVRKDPIERSIYSSMAALSFTAIRDCDYPSIIRMTLPSLENLAEQAKIYAVSDSTDDIKVGANTLSEMIGEMVDRYDLRAALEGRKQPEPSKMYCEMKLKNINVGASAMFEALKGSSQ